MRGNERAKKYSKELNLNDYFEKNMTDVWDGINELQRATKAVALIALVSALMYLKSRGGITKQ